MVRSPRTVAHDFHEQERHEPELDCGGAHELFLLHWQSRCSRRGFGGARGPSRKLRPSTRRSRRRVRRPSHAEIVACALRCQCRLALPAVRTLRPRQVAAATVRWPPCHASDAALKPGGMPGESTDSEGAICRTTSSPWRPAASFEERRRLYRLNRNPKRHTIRFIHRLYRSDARPASASMTR